MTERKDLEEIAKEVSKATPARLFAAAQKSEEHRHALVMLREQIVESDKTSKETVSASSESTDETGERAQKRQKANAAAKLMIQIIVECSKIDFFIARAQTMPQPPQNDAAKNIVYWAAQLKSACFHAGLSWVNLCDYSETFCKSLLAAHQITAGVRTVLEHRVQGDKAPSEKDKLYLEVAKEMRSKWHDFNTGFELLYVIKMHPVAKLMKKYPRLQGFSSPPAMIPHVAYIRDALDRDADLSFFADPVETIHEKAKQIAQVPQPQAPPSQVSLPQSPQAHQTQPMRWKELTETLTSLEQRYQQEKAPDQKRLIVRQTLETLRSMEGIAQSDDNKAYVARCYSCINQQTLTIHPPPPPPSPDSMQ